MTVPFHLRGVVRKARLCLLPAGLLLLLWHDGQAADTVIYNVTIHDTGEKALDDAAKESATLVQLREQGEVSPALLIARARTDAERLVQAMHSLGHYGGTTQIKIAGHALEDVELSTALEAWPEGKAVPVDLTLQPGPVFKLRHITLQGDAAGQRLGLTEGDDAVASQVLAAGSALQSALLASGHALARVEPPVADVGDGTVDLTFAVNAGPQVNIGRIDVTGLANLQAEYVRKRLTLESGTPFSPAALDAARADLAKVPALASVRLVPGRAVDPDGTLPVEVALTERKRRAVSLSAAFSTDQGGNTTVAWTNRNLLGRAEVLNLSAGIDQIAASAARQPGYKIASLLTLPDWRRRGQSLDFSALAIRETLEAYDRTAVVIGTTLRRRLAPQWTASVGVTGEQAYFVQDKIGRSYSLLQAPLGLHYDTSNSLIEPTSGIRADALLTPSESLSRHSASFLIAQVSGAGYVDLEGAGRGVLALRGVIGTVGSVKPADIPPDQRFYGGGSGTIRGYRYQSVGPSLSNGKPQGGTALSAGTVEFRQRIGESYGVAGFVDAGQVANNGLPFTGKFRTGVGIGGRYYTSIGPIRADFAIPLIHQHGSDSFEAYIGLGEAF